MSTRPIEDIQGRNTNTNASAIRGILAEHGLRLENVTFADGGGWQARVSSADASVKVQATGTGFDVAGAIVDAAIGLLRFIAHEKRSRERL